MKLRIGDVVRVWDRGTRPPKHKRLICICPERRMFFRINSRALFPPHLLLRADGADFLDHDSYVELQQLLKPFELELEQAELLGRLTPTHVRLLRIAVENCVALSDELKEFVADRLDSYR